MWRNVHGSPSAGLWADPGHREVPSNRRVSLMSTGATHPMSVEGSLTFVTFANIEVLEEWHVLRYCNSLEGVNFKWMKWMFEKELLASQVQRIHRNSLTRLRSWHGVTFRACVPLFSTRILWRSFRIEAPSFFFVDTFDSDRCSKPLDGRLAVTSS